MNIDWRWFVRNHFGDQIPQDAEIGWHWLKEDRRLRYGDDRLVLVGETLTAMKTDDARQRWQRNDGDIPATVGLCDWGMHAGYDIFTLNQIVPQQYQSWLCLVWVNGDLDRSDDHKFCGLHRHCLGMLHQDVVEIPRYSLGAFFVYHQRACSDLYHEKQQALRSLAPKQGNYTVRQSEDYKLINRQYADAIGLAEDYFHLIVLSLMGVQITL